MPIYEYECETTGQHIDIRQSFNDDPLTACPHCGGPTHRVIQPASIVFKGSGFYVNDHKGGNNPTARPAKKDETGSTEGATTPAKAAETTTAPAAPSAPVTPAST